METTNRNTTINAVEIRGMYDAFVLRNIRNECREFMTRDTAKVGFIKQIEWFYFTYKPLRRVADSVAYLFKNGNRTLGYGYVRNIHSAPTISGGLYKKYRGKGYGRYLFEWLTEFASTMYTQYPGQRRPVHLEVLSTNVIAHELYKKIGYKETKRKGNIVTMIKKYEY